ncbi:aldehyde dehydrogenase family protein [Frigidibacter sp.]|uniref:aldehyde dehydrogenase family protein n=1 Tax=Frigidibacter sp. TaxID=2586418 RepID=UPI0027331E4A|nr:aldehyde dehydrogenase family protein [Frigidibacter sp.]MDP3342151.1 aldehyde dehydrogenase family protein [Frigidibacter sp.]
MTISTTGRPAGFAVHNPATGAVIGDAPNMTAADLDRAVARARAAQPGWAAAPDDQRAEACRALAALLTDHSEELARLLTQEQGKPLNGLGSRWEIGGAAAWAGYTAGLSLPPKVLQDDATARVELHRKPVGVVGSITPWNFPVMIAIWHIVPALRVGNTVVMKPSPLTPLAALRFVELASAVLPAGVLTIVTGDDRAVNLGAEMTSHPGIDKIVFTGSTATGRQVMRSAAGTLKRLTLELGGNDAGIVLPDADPGLIAEGLFWGAFINNGQTCAALKRLYVHDDIHDQVCDALVEYTRNIPVGDGMDEASILGPVQNRMQFDIVSGLVASAADRGQVLLGGQPGEGLFFPPTLIAGLANGDPLVDREQFGPALPIIRYTDVAGAVAAANDNPNGLGGSIWSSDLDAARAIALQLECGSAWINKHGAVQPNAPFGGVKSSGMGVQFAEEGLAENTVAQVVFS